ncbi:MAG: paraquat-inducible protein A [Planctomycetota bacterium]
MSDAATGEGAPQAPAAERAMPPVACPTCGLVQRVPPLAVDERARCARCAAVVRAPSRSARSESRTAALALAALLLWPAAVTLPVMHIERFGRMNDASVWSGSVGLLQRGEWFVGGVVFVCSFVLPLLKLLALLAITLGRRFMERRMRAFTYRLVDWTGRWGMLDVLLVAVVVAWVKLGDFADVAPGPGAVAFTLLVLASLVAGATFDPHVIWEDHAA